MNRRNFIKWLLSGLVFFFGSGFVWLRGLKDPNILSSGMAPASSADPSSPSETPDPSGGKGNLLLSLFLLSDLHVTVDAPAITEKLRKALDDLTTMEEQIEAIVLGGDLTDFARDADYKRLKDILSEHRLPPIFGSMGNHDYYTVWLDQNGQYAAATVPNGRTDEDSRKKFQELLNVDKPYHDARVNGVHLIMLSQDTYVQERPEVLEGAWYSDAQLQWLRQILKPHADGSPALLFIHQPLPAPGSDGGTHRLIRAKAFRNILKPYPNLFVFSGHTHQDFNVGSHYSKETFHWFMNASVGKTKGAESLSQGMFIQVYEKAVVVKGREFSQRAWIDAADWEIPL